MGFGVSKTAFVKIDYQCSTVQFDINAIPEWCAAENKLMFQAIM